MEPTFPPEGTDGRCPHCGVLVHFRPAPSIPGTHPQEAARPAAMAVPDRGRQLTHPVMLAAAQCPSCAQSVVMLAAVEPPTKRWVWPAHAARDPIPEAVPDVLAQDYREAALVLPYSAKASAALSRRCLENLLHQHGHAAPTLAAAIDRAAPTLPPYLAADLGYVREVGNFAAHPRKSQATGELLGVEPGEADWTLEVLEELFDFYYARPAASARRRAALNAKLTDAGKKPLA